MRGNPPVFNFFLDSERLPVRSGDGLWQRPLPLARDAHHGPLQPAVGPVTGDYFNAVKTFLTMETHRYLAGAIPNEVRGGGRLPESVDIHLVKHGAFYHPARIVIHMGDRQFSRVVNVAVSTQGKAAVAEEVAALRRLYGRGPGLIPPVYGAAENIGPHGMALFIADWLEGFYEWHLTGEDTDGVCRRVVVWDAVHGHREMSDGQIRRLFSNTAAALAGYYDVSSSCHIGRWHHGAGDFVVRTEGADRVDVRLITVRRYAPLVAGVADRPENMIDALLVFLLDLTLKNRLDRRDGVGDLVMAETAAVGWTLAGFLDGMAHQVREGHLPDGFPGNFIDYVDALGGAEITQMAEALIDRMPSGSETHVLCCRHLDSHLDAFLSEIAACRRRVI